MLGVELDALGSKKNRSVGPALANCLTNPLLILPVQTSDTRYGKDLRLRLCTEAGRPNYL